MPVRKYCKYDGCKKSPNCEHGWHIDIVFKGKRYHYPVDEFAAPRMDADELHAVTSKREAEQKWEALFLAELNAGKDPRIAPIKSAKPAAPGDTTIAIFLDEYFTKHVKPAKLSSQPTIASQINVLKKYLGTLNVSALEKVDVVNDFKVNSDYAEDNTLASVHRVLETLRTSINWGLAQKPQYVTVTPFHKFGVRMNKKDEVQRDRRISRDEERLILKTALEQMNTNAYKHIGPLMHDRFIGAIELLCRRGEMMLIQNRRVNWDENTIGIPGATAKDGDNRRIPFDPDGPLMPILEKRKKLGPLAYIFGTENGTYQESFQGTWETLRLLAYGVEPKSDRYGTKDYDRNMKWNREKLAEIDLRWHDLRHEGACRLLARGVDIRTIQLMLGHSTLIQTQRYLNVTDEELRLKMEAGWKLRAADDEKRGKRGLRMA